MTAVTAALHDVREDGAEDQHRVASGASQDKHVDAPVASECFPAQTPATCTVCVCRGMSGCLYSYCT
jgi:hypothetical protein